MISSALNVNLQMTAVYIYVIYSTGHSTSRCYMFIVSDAHVSHGRTYQSSLTNSQPQDIRKHSDECERPSVTLQPMWRHEQ